MLRKLEDSHVDCRRHPCKLAASTMAVLKILTLLALISLLFSTIHAKSNNTANFQWQILSSKNFSSQIRLHPHILLFITVPWCGESRSLMNEVSQKLSKEQETYCSLKLMLIYRNLEKTLADSLGAAEGITVLCYHHGMSFKYQGINRERDILSSVFYIMSLATEDLPLKRIGNSKDMEMFLASTDKAIILLESCGWTSKLLVDQTGNGTVQELWFLNFALVSGVMQREAQLMVARKIVNVAEGDDEFFMDENLVGSHFPGDLNRETDQTLVSGSQKNLKDGENDTNCDVQHVCGESPWVGEYSAENRTASTDEDMQPTSGTSCSFKEFSKFKSFFSKFMILARDMYLPPQRQRYGFVSDRSLLSTLGAEDFDQWSVIISYAGCLSCLRKFKDEIHLQKALEMHDLPVLELPDDGKGLRPALPVDKPSVVLFVDRTSDSVETRESSQKALRLFKELALQYWKSHPTDWQSIDPTKGSLHTYQDSTSVFKNHRFLVSPSSQIKLDDKMSIMIIDEGQQVTFGNEASQSGSLHEILTYLVGQRKQAKLNTLAKEAGFQLLSDEIDIKIANVLPSLEGQDQDSSIKSDVASEESINDKIKDSTDEVAPLADQEQLYQPINVEASSEYSNQQVSIDSAIKESGIGDPHQSPNDQKLGSGQDVDLDIQPNAENTEISGLRRHLSAFTGSFFFSDGNYKFLRSLTQDSQVPRIVIIDPLSQQHYVLSEEANYDIVSLSTFIKEFLNGSLTPFQRSGPLRKSVEMPQPPFVNLDFREKDSIPVVTADTFSELVLGSGESNAQDALNAWHKDVVVLFSSSWCGICQRMELIVREVYWALKSYVNMVESETKGKRLFSQGRRVKALREGLAKVVVKKEMKLRKAGVVMEVVLSALMAVGWSLGVLPATTLFAGRSNVLYSPERVMIAFLVDGLLPHLSLSKSVHSAKEVYPSLLLFPAERKTAIVYDGNMMVTDIIKFIANHGSRSDHLARQKGNLWTDLEERKNQDDEVRVAMSRDTKKSSDVTNKYFGTNMQNAELQNSAILQKPITPNPIVGSFLVATEHLDDSNLFNKAKILIVGAEHGVGFQGLIVNKPIPSWDSLPRLRDVKLLEGALVSFGGPVIQQEMPLVSLARISFNNQYPQVLPGVYLLDQLETLGKIKDIEAGNLSATDLWFFWGYSGWSWDQLLNEIAEGSWKLHEGSVEDLQWPK
uniref:Thioredoxin domain-containing protein n=1 Tax=Chenopodium quinoa TaxID=63459 RepID=A0A803LSI4_CHEQI